MTILNTQTLVRSTQSQVEQLSPAVDTALVLPSASNMLGKIWTIINSGTANILIQSSTGALVRTVYPGTTGQVTPNTDSPTTAAHWEGIGLVVSNFTSYSPTFNAALGTITNKVFNWYRVGSNLHLEANWTNGTVDNATTVKIPLPTGLVGSVSVAQGLFGIMSTDYSGNQTGQWFPIMLPADTANIQIGNNLLRNNFAPINSSAFVTGNVSLKAIVPIVGWSATKG